MASNGKVKTTPEQAVEGALRRMKAVWRAQGWTPDLIAEYRRVLSRLGDPELVTAVVDQVIDSTVDRFAPPPGVFVRAGEELRSSRRTVESTPGPGLPGEREKVDLEAIAADAPPAIAAAINRARARILEEG